MARILSIFIVLSILAAAVHHAGAMGYRDAFQHLSVQVAEAGETRENAIAELRRANQSGLESLLRTWRGVTMPDQETAKLLMPDQRAHVLDAIDRVAQQKDAAWSGLYWYTDLDAAKSEAARLNKPILSLRLLGKLTDEYSCANSRFFRTVLYANPDVAGYLKRNYVLHWESVRAVPVVTIDFGDGRIVRRTITGNSIHYVLDPQGRVVDAIPGLYAPAEFIAIVTAAHDAAVIPPGQTEAQRVAQLTAYHREAGRRVLARLSAELPAAGVYLPVLTPVAARPDAADAVVLARPKMLIEQPLLAAIDHAFADKLDRDLSDDQWIILAERRLEAAKLHANSLALMRWQNRAAYTADPDLLDRTAERFEKLIAIDTVRNETMFRRRILHVLAENPASMLDAAALNDRIYAELFLTPGDDATLGLIPEATYTALVDDGCATPPSP